jgi:DNA-binding NarL/FixJ family response regulator
VDNPVRVVVVDDAVLLRQALARLLTDAGFDVLAQAGDVDGLRHALAVHRPDVVVLDIRLPPDHRLEGLRAAVDLRRADPGRGVLLLSQHVETQLLPDLLAAGSRGLGYLLKERVAGIDAFLEAVRTVAAGGCVLDPTVVGRLMTARHRAAPLAKLTGREREILSLMAQGRSNQAISRQLTLTGKTVETHVRNILLRLELPPEPDDHRRVLAVLHYLRAGG